MFDELFDRRHARERHLGGPMLAERLAFLQHQAHKELARDTLRATANHLLAICEEFDLAARCGEQISEAEIKEKAVRWANGRKLNGRRKKGAPDAVRRFSQCATQWLRFQGMLEEPEQTAPAYAPLVDAYLEYLRRERGLSPATIIARKWVASDFLGRLESASTELSKLKADGVDSLLRAKVTDSGYARVSVRTYAGTLRCFLRYAEQKAWCRGGLAKTVKPPRVYSHERLPCGPAWEDVQRVLATTEDEHPTNVRDRAILLLLAVYGLRQGEVVRLQLNDFDWEQELLTVRRSKSRNPHIYPLSKTVGAAVLHYITDIRPQTTHREVFLTRRAPWRPLRAGIWRIVASRLRPLGLELQHHGPHAMRHACATYLLTQGFSMKEIGDHLGHRDPEATRIYAKVDLNGLRRVAEFDLGELLWT